MKEEKTSLVPLSRFINIIYRIVRETICKENHVIPGTDYKIHAIFGALDNLIRTNLKDYPELIDDIVPVCVITPDDMTKKVIELDFMHKNHKFWNMSEFGRYQLINLS